MTIKIGEVGKTLYVGTTFDLNAAPFTVLTINFTSPDGSVTFQRTSPEVQAPTVDSPPLPNVGVLPANTYMTYLTQASDFDTAGEWTVCCRYEDAAPSLFDGSDAILVIEDGCG